MSRREHKKRELADSRRARADEPRNPRQLSEPGRRGGDCPLESRHPGRAPGTNRLATRAKLAHAHARAHARRAQNSTRTLMTASKLDSCFFTSKLASTFVSTMT